MLYVNWCDLSSRELHQTVPEGAVLAIGQGHIYPRPSPVSFLLKPKHNEKFIAPFLASLSLLFAQALSALMLLTAL